MEITASLLHYYLKQDHLFKRKVDIAKAFKLQRKSFPKGERKVIDYLKDIGKFDN